MRNPSQHITFNPLLLDFRPRERAGRKGRGDVAGTDGIDSDGWSRFVAVHVWLGTPFCGGRARELVEGGFGGVVGGCVDALIVFVSP